MTENPIAPTMPRMQHTENLVINVEFQTYPRNCIQDPSAIANENVLSRCRIRNHNISQKKADQEANSISHPMDPQIIGYLNTNDL